MPLLEMMTFVLPGRQCEAIRTKQEHMELIPCAMLQMPAITMTRSLPSPLQRRQAEATLTEVFPAPGAEAAAAGFVVAQLRHGTGTILWIQDRLTRSETGRPYLMGLHRPLMLMQLSRPLDVMTAMEEGLRCKALTAVIAEIRGDPVAVNFTSMKRLTLRAEATGIPCWLIRQSATANLSAARNRWRIATLPSAPNPDDPQSPGDALWRVELFRSRDGQPGEWVARDDRRAARTGAEDRLDLVAAVTNGTLAKDAGTRKQHAAR